MPEVRFIAAIDEKRGIAKEQKIPWHLPADQAYFRAKLATGPVVMGLKTYISNGRKPYGSFENVVFSAQDVPADNVVVEHDAVAYFKSLDHDVWVAGGGQIFEAALSYATELYLTRVQGDYGCDVFFPKFEDRFYLAEQGEEQVENGIKFRFEIWRPIAG